MSAGRGRSRLSLSAVALVVLGAFVGGWFGGLAAVGGVIIAARFGPRPVACLALGALAVAAVATLGEAPSSPRAFGSEYAFLRPVAARSALVSGVLAFVAVVCFALQEREGPSARGGDGAVSACNSPDL